MAEPQIEATTREIFGNKVKVLRRNNLLPGNVYGAGITSTAIQLDMHEFERLRARVAGRVLIKLQIKGEAQPRTVMVRELKKDPVTNSLLHVEFHQMQMDRLMKTSVSLVLTGESEAVSRHHGILIQTLNTVDIECMPHDLPAEIFVDVAPLRDVGQVLHVSDVKLGPGVTVLTDPEQVIARVQTPTVEVEAGEEPEEAKAEQAEAEEEAEGEAEKEDES